MIDLAASDLGHLLLHLDRRVVSNANSQQPDRPVAQLLRLAHDRQVTPTIRDHNRGPVRVMANTGHASMIPADPDARGPIRMTMIKASDAPAGLEPGAVKVTRDGFRPPRTAAKRRGPEERSLRDL